MNKIMTSLYVATDIDVESKDNYGAVVSISPFASGHAVTLAHPIRRLIMSSTVGHSPIAVKINGAKHEFDNIVGMVEDVAVFIVNLKRISFKIIDNNQDEITLNYSFRGRKEVTGKDLENDKVKIFTPDNHLATLNEDCSLDFSLIIKKGIGYVAIENFRDELPSEYIPIDAFFSPVKKATYKIDKVLVNDDPSFEKITFTINTDGQVDPINAFKNAVVNMNAQMSIFKDIIDFDAVTVEKPKVERDTTNIKDLLVKIEDLNLSARSFNSLDNNNIRYIGQIVLMSSVELRGVKNLGKKSYEEILDKVKEYNFTLSYQLNEERQKLFDLEVAKLTKK